MKVKTMNSLVNATERLCSVTSQPYGPISPNSWLQLRMCALMTIRLTCCGTYLWTRWAIKHPCTQVHTFIISWMFTHDILGKMLLQFINQSEEEKSIVSMIMFILVLGILISFHLNSIWYAQLTALVLFALRENRWIHEYFNWVPRVSNCSLEAKMNRSKNNSPCDHNLR